MIPTDLRTTRTYYWTWQALSLAMTVLIGAITYWLLRPFRGSPAETDPGSYLVVGIIVGIVVTNAWNRLKYKAPRRRPDTWHPGRSEG